MVDFQSLRRPPNKTVEVSSKLPLEMTTEIRAFTCCTKKALSFLRAGKYLFDLPQAIQLRLLTITPQMLII